MRISRQSHMEDYQSTHRLRHLAQCTTQAKNKGNTMATNNNMQCMTTLTTLMEQLAKLAKDPNTDVPISTLPKAARKVHHATSNMTRMHHRYQRKGKERVNPDLRLQQRQQKEKNRKTMLPFTPMQASITTVTRLNRSRKSHTMTTFNGSKIT